jgi:hypothetical protein
MAIGNRINLTVRVLFFASHVYESFAGLQQDYGHVGFKGRGSSQVLSLSRQMRAARHQMIETFPATRIRRTAHCALQCIWGH